MRGEIMHKKGNLFVVSGPSGAGKGTIIREISKNDNDFKLSVSVTTRAPRNKEIEGVNYYFKTKEEFMDMIENDEFLEYAEVYDNFYGTPKKPVLEAVEKGENIILEIDIQGAIQVKKNYPEGIFIFILPPTMAELKNRIIERGSETDETLKKRMLSAFHEISYMEKYDYFIINDVLEDSIKSFKSIIKAEKCRVMANVKNLLKTYEEEL
ncbi:MAG: guanylate kinase [Clostridiales bacterium]|nr:guanylate kinase [Clostridiales bacterium]